MNSIRIEHTHNISKEDACLRAEEMFEDLANDYNLDIEHDGDGQICFYGSGIKGSVEIDHARVIISANLSFLMIAMKSVISDKIKLRLEEIF